MKALWKQITEDPSGFEMAIGAIIAIAGLFFCFFHPDQAQYGLGIIVSGSGVLTGTAITGRQIVGGPK
jgi:hypothetical protein